MFEKKHSALNKEVQKCEEREVVTETLATLTRNDMSIQKAGIMDTSRYLWNVLEQLKVTEDLIQCFSSKRKAVKVNFMSANINQELKRKSKKLSFQRKYQT